MTLMGIKKTLLKGIALCALAALLFLYLNIFLPYREDGSLNPLVVLIAFGILATLVFFLCQTVLSLFLKHRSASQIAFVGSFALLQIILMNSWSFINLSSMLVIILFNFFVCWYALKVL